jgi:dipeptidase
MALFALSLLWASPLGCTTLIAGRGATVDGSTLATHSNDGEGNVDPRLVHIPARDHAPGSQRPVFWSPETFPRYVGFDRGAEAYHPVGKQRAWEPIGHIDEVAHTYGYHEQTYGALNEHGVGIGESTCAGVFAAAPLGRGGHALFSVDQLTQLAMERTTTSREAVQLMGALAVSHGFYGADNATEGSAESLMVIDPQEAFIFHILPDDTGASAIWVAQRVPDDHVGVVANAFMIRDVDLSDMHAIARAHGLWDGTGALDFTRAFSDGEYLHKYYSGRRVWGAYALLAKSARLEPEYGEWRASRAYPATLKPDQKVSVADFARVMRSYYQGTPFDQTRGLAAGPWGSPDHAMANGGSAGREGSWERTIAIWRTSDSHIVQARAGVPRAVRGVLWWGAHTAATTVYLPFFSGATSLPREARGHYEALDKGSLLWGSRYVFNLVQLKYVRAIAHVRALQAAYEGAAAKRLLADAALVAATAPAAEVGPRLAKLSSAHAARALAALWLLFDELMFTYGDGFVARVGSDGSYVAEADPYPDWWLDAVNYTHGPPPVPAGARYPQRSLATRRP